MKSLEVVCDLSRLLSSGNTSLNVVVWVRRWYSHKQPVSLGVHPVFCNTTTHCFLEQPPTIKAHPISSHLSWSHYNAACGLPDCILDNKHARKGASEEPVWFQKENFTLYLLICVTVATKWPIILSNQLSNYAFVVVVCLMWHELKQLPKKKTPCWKKQYKPS